LLFQKTFLIFTPLLRLKFSMIELTYIQYSNISVLNGIAYLSKSPICNVKALTSKANTLTSIVNTLTLIVKTQTSIAKALTSTINALIVIISILTLIIKTQTSEIRTLDLIVKARISEAEIINHKMKAINRIINISTY